MKAFITHGRGLRTHEGLCGALLAVGAILALTAGGCSLGSRSSGVRLIGDGDYAEAVAALQADEVKRPADPVVKRNLGIAFYLSGDAQAAEEKLVSARDLNPQDAPSVYYLGRACDALGKIDCALEAYTSYLVLSGKGKAEVHSRIRALSIQKATEEIRQAIALERNLQIDAIPQNSFVVPDFVNVTEIDSLAPLSRGLAAMLITDLGKVKSLRVLERQRIGILLAELNMAQRGSPTLSAADTLQWAPINTTRGLKQRLQALLRPDSDRPYYQGPLDDNREAAFLSAVKAFQADNGLAADGIPGARTRGALNTVLNDALETAVRPGAIINPETAPRLGTLLGARHFIQGSFVALAGEQVQLDAGLIEITGNDLQPAGEPVVGPLRRVLHLEKSLVYQILDHLGIDPTAAERKEIERLPTEDFLAFLSFCRGLELEDRGMTAAAADAYGEALQRDSGFDEAATREETTQVSQDDQAELDRAEAVSGDGGGDDQRQRLDGTAGQSGLGPEPNSERQSEDDPARTPADIVSDAARITVSGELPQR